MTRAEIVSDIKKYFDIRELVCPHTYAAFGNKSWQFLQTQLLYNLLVIRRDILQVPLTINTWHINGQFSQRGNRCNVCSLVKEKTKIYLSAHTTCAAVDFDANGFTAEQVRIKILAQQSILPYPIRLEKDTTWVHLDVYDPVNGKKINFF